MSKPIKSIIKSNPKRAIYDKENIYKILDNNSLCHVGFIHNGVPVVIPTSYGRIGNKLYIHGAQMSRMLTELEKEIPISVSIARETGLVVARSSTHHSVNYESVVVFGTGKVVNDDEKLLGLKSILENILPGRWEEVRNPTEKELKVTKVIAISIDEATGKKRDEGVFDKKMDMEANVWAGVVPILRTYGKPEPDAPIQKNKKLPESINKLYK